MTSRFIDIDRFHWKAAAIPRGMALGIGLKFDIVPLLNLAMPNTKPNLTTG